MSECQECSHHFLTQHGSHWVFNLASLYWRSIGDGWNTIECLRRAIHFAPNENKDIGYIGLANTLQRHGYLNDAVLTARAALDIRPDSVSEREWSLTHSLHSLTHSLLTHPLTQPTHSLTHSLTLDIRPDSPTHSPTHSLTHPLTHPLTHSHTHTLTHSSFSSSRQSAITLWLAHTSAQAI